MKNLVKGIFFCGFSLIVFAQTPFIKINNEETSLEKFTQTQNINLKELGVQKSIDLFTEFELLKQYALNNRAEESMPFLITYNKALKNLKEENYFDAETYATELPKFYDKIRTEFEVQAIVIPKEKVRSVETTITQNPTKFTENIQKYSIDKSFVTPIYLEYKMLDDSFFKAINSLKINEISKPIPNGENLIFIKKTNQRPNLGNLLLQRIVVSDEAKAHEVSQKITSGEMFTKLVLEFSEVGKESQGYLKDVISGLPVEVYQALKNLKEGEVTKPVLVNGKYQIIKIVAKESLDTYKEAYPLVRKLFKESNRFYELSDEKYLKVSNEAIALNTENVQDFCTHIAQYFKDSANYKNYTKPLLNFNNELVTQASILERMKEANPPKIDPEFASIVIGEMVYSAKRELYENQLFFLEERIKPKVDSIKKENLINFAFDELLLKNAYKDDAGLQKYLESKPERFTLDQRAELEKYICLDEATANEVLKLVKKKKSSKEIITAFKEKVNAQNVPFVIAENGKITQDSDRFPKQASFKKGKEIVPLEEGKFCVMNIKEILPKQLMSVEEAKLTLYEEYQSVYYQNTLKDLKSKAKVTIDEHALDILNNHFNK